MIRYLSVFVALLFLMPAAVAEDGDPETSGYTPPEDPNHPPEEDPNHPPEEEYQDPNGTEGDPHDHPETKEPGPDDRPSYCRFYEFTGDFPRPSVSVNPLLGWVMIYPYDCLERPGEIYFPPPPIVNG